METQKEIRQVFLAQQQKKASAHIASMESENGAEAKAEEHIQSDQKQSQKNQEKDNSQS